MFTIARSGPAHLLQLLLLLQAQGLQTKNSTALIGFSQRAQYPLIKEYSLNHNMKPLYSLIKGYWALWVGLHDCRAFLGSKVQGIRV